MDRTTPDSDRLRNVIADAVAELDATHHPMWTSDQARSDGKDPIGCTTCYPGDSSWPCITRLVADDLRNALPHDPATGSDDDAAAAGQ